MKRAFAAVTPMSGSVNRSTNGRLGEGLNGRKLTSFQAYTLNEFSEKWKVHSQ